MSRKDLASVGFLAFFLGALVALSQMGMPTDILRSHRAIASDFLPVHDTARPGANPVTGVGWDPVTTALNLNVEVSR
jgi:hypothetical protein